MTAPIVTLAVTRCPVHYDLYSELRDADGNQRRTAVLDFNLRLIRENRYPIDRLHVDFHKERKTYEVRDLAHLETLVQQARRDLMEQR